MPERNITASAAHLDGPREQVYRQMLDAVEDAAVMELSLRGRIRTWGASARGITGYTAEEAVGQPVSLLYTPQDVAAGKNDRPLAEARQCGSWRGDERLVRKDGALFRGHTTLLLMRDADGAPAGFLRMTHDASKALRLAELESARRHVHAFLAVLAHELRNPLSPILHAVEVIRLAGVEDLRVRQCAETIARQAGQLARLVSDLLDVGRVTSGKLRVNRVPTVYGDVVTSSVEAIRPMTEAAAQRISVRLPAQPVHVHGDAARLGQVLLNLLSNASKYTPRGGAISVTVTAADGVVSTTIDDTGHGIAPAALDRIFNLFTQEAAETNKGGLGIGLALAKAIVEAHGGAIQADSAGTGRGSSFTVILPSGDGASS